MKNPKTNFSALTILGVGALLILRSVAFAQVDFSHREYGANSKKSTTYANWNHYGPTGRQYSLWTDPYQEQIIHLDYSVFVQSNAAASCYEVITRAASFPPTFSDTRIYAQNTSSTWRSVSDDVSGTDKTSYARAWIGSSKGITFRIGGRRSSLGDNHIDIEKKAITTKEACRVSGKPFLDFSTGAWPTFVDTN